jgi:hypothetical protein
MVKTSEPGEPAYNAVTAIAHGDGHGERDA